MSCCFLLLSYCLLFVEIDRYASEKAILSQKVCLISSKKGPTLACQP